MGEKILVEQRVKNNNALNKNSCLALFLVILITAIVFSGSLKLAWTNWDDDLYVYKNPIVSQGTLKDILTKSGDYNMYVPLVIASFALEWKMVQDSPFLYHVDNLLLHLFCTAMVLLFFRRLGLSIWWSGFAALLFGIHPMRVETVAWITERKELLCAFFYLAALLAYLRYIASGKRRYFLFTFLFMILSLSSKTEALTLPFTLVLLDWYFQRNINLKIILEKTFFFAVVFALTVPQYFLFGNMNPASINSQAIVNAFNVFEQAVLGCYVYAIYILKSIAPYATSAIYPIPLSLQAEHWIGAVIAIVIFISALAGWRKYRFVTFGLLFFTFNIGFLILVSFFLSDFAFLNDRYTYVAYIGLFFVMAMSLQKLSIKVPSFRWLITFLAGFLLITFGVLTVRYIPVWQNSETLWTYVINKYPRQLAVAHFNRGNYWYENQQWDKALEDFTAAIEINPEYSSAYMNRSLTYLERHENQKALQDYTNYMNLLYPPDGRNGGINLYLSKSFSHRGSIYFRMEQYDNALIDFNKAIECDPFSQDNYLQRAFAYMELREYDKAISDFNLCHQSDPKNSDIINNRGVCYLRSGNLKSALDDFNKAILLNSSSPLYFVNRAATYLKLGKLADARRDVQIAEQMGAAIDPSFKKKLRLR